MVVYIVQFYKGIALSKNLCSAIPVVHSKLQYLHYQIFVSRFHHQIAKKITSQFLIFSLINEFRPFYLHYSHHK